MSTKTALVQPASNSATAERAVLDDRATDTFPAHDVKPMRADARRNREAILTAATDMFSAQGANAPLEDVARQAGVGIGTLYRHFPTREDLVFAVYKREVDRLCAAVPELLAEYDAATATREWMLRFVDYAATKRGLVEPAPLDDGRGQEPARRGQEQSARRRGRTALDRAAAGVIRADADPDDLTRALGGICMTGEGPDWKDKAVRLVDLVYDGLRFGAPNA